MLSNMTIYKYECFGARASQSQRAKGQVAGMSQKKPMTVENKAARVVIAVVWLAAFVLIIAYGPSGLQLDNQRGLVRIQRGGRRTNARLRATVDRRRPWRDEPKYLMLVTGNSGPCRGSSNTVSHL